MHSPRKDLKRLSKGGISEDHSDYFVLQTTEDVDWSLSMDSREKMPVVQDYPSPSSNSEQSASKNMIVIIACSAFAFIFVLVFVLAFVKFWWRQPEAPVPIETVVDPEGATNQRTGVVSVERPLHSTDSV